MPRPDRVTRLIRLIAVTEAITEMLNGKHREALFSLASEMVMDLSDDDCVRISKVKRALVAEATELVNEWATDTP